jgi:ketosteroid isomerase-like protein
VSAFLAAARGGDFEALLAVLDPDVVLRADPTAVTIGAPAQRLGAAAVAETFSGRAQGAQLAAIDGVTGAAWLRGGRLRMVFTFTVTDGRITAIDMLADPTRLGDLDLEVLEN